MIALCALGKLVGPMGRTYFLSVSVIMVTILVIILLLASIGAHAVANAIQHKADKLSPTYALLSGMRLSSSTNVLVSAEQVIQHIFSTYSEPNLAPEEFQSRALLSARIHCASSAVSASPTEAMAKTTAITL